MLVDEHLIAFAKSVAIEGFIKVELALRAGLGWRRNRVADVEPRQGPLGERSPTSEGGSVEYDPICSWAQLTVNEYSLLSGGTVKRSRTGVAPATCRRDL